MTKLAQALSPDALARAQRAIKPMDYTLHRDGRAPQSMSQPGPTPMGFQILDAMLGTRLRPTQRMLGGMRNPTSPLTLLRTGTLPSRNDAAELLRQIASIRQGG